jgi:hypothetical protein
VKVGLEMDKGIGMKKKRLIHSEPNALHALAVGLTHRGYIVLD